MTAMAVERWLHMSRRSLITVRRVYVIEAVLTIIPVPYMAVRRLPGMEPYFDTNVPFVAVIEGTLAICCFAVSSFAYFKVFRIINHHQRRVHTTTHSYGPGQAVINLEKYKKSVRTILWVWALFLLCYSPFALSTVFANALNVSDETSLTILHLATTTLLMSSSLNPFLYIWRCSGGIRRNHSTRFKRFTCILIQPTECEKASQLHSQGSYQKESSKNTHAATRPRVTISP